MWSGIEAVTSGASRMFQIAFWLLVPIILTNVLISFILEVYLKKWEYYKENYSEDYYLSNYQDDREIQVEDREKPTSGNVSKSLNQVELEKAVFEHENLTGAQVDNVENDKDVTIFAEGNIYDVE